FERIFAAFSLYSKEEATKSEANNRNCKEKYDSLHKVRPIWQMAIKSFQRCRNPSQHLALDESMAKFMVRHNAVAMFMSCSI
ncbi:MAG: hypothetical protein GY816_07070, partial [Cytophagales bacterium]|nr:hypothetical protein [Cytophagales bacterium]